MSEPIYLADEAATRNAAIKFANNVEKGDIIGLSGPLGAGKSTFARALIRFLSNTDDLTVPSPTFTLVQTYETQLGPLWHFDLYRLDHPEDIYETGWEEIAGIGICLVEWPENLPLSIQKNMRHIRFEISGEGRNMTINKQ